MLGFLLIDCGDTVLYDDSDRGRSVLREMRYAHYIQPSLQRTFKVDYMSSYPRPERLEMLVILLMLLADWFLCETSRSFGRSGKSGKIPL